MKHRGIYLVLLIFFTNFCPAQSQRHDIAAPVMNTAKWKEDTRFLEDQITKLHANAYHTIGEKALRNNFKDLSDSLGKFKDEEILIRISEIMASIGDAHTWLDFRNSSLTTFHYLPIAVDWFEDGMFIINASDKYKNTIAKKITSINRVPIDTIIRKVRRIGYRENEYTAKFSVPLFLPIVEVLKYYKIIDLNDVVLGFENSESVIIEKSDFLLQPVKYNYQAETNPPYLKSQCKTFWYKEYQTAEILYVQINKCADDSAKTLATFAEELIDKIAEGSYQSVILDLRNNIGGNSKLMHPFIYVLQTYSRSSPNGKIFVAISRKTLSASIVFCDEIQKYCEAIFIGEPSGAKPNLYGENSYFLVLPNSKLKISFASEYFQAAGPFNKNNFLTTDIYLPPTSKDFFGGVDPVLDFVADTTNSILRFDNDFNNYIKEHKYSLALNRLEGYYLFPENKYKDIEQLIRRTANKLNVESTKDIAKQLYDINLKFYPDKALPHISLAEYYFSNSDYGNALSFYNKGKQLLKSDPSVYAAFRYRLEDIISARLRTIAEKTDPNK